MISWIFKKKFTNSNWQTDGKGKKGWTGNGETGARRWSGRAKKGKKRGEKWVRVDGGFWWDKEEGTAAAAATVTTAARS